MDLFLIGHVGVLGTCKIRKEKESQILEHFPGAIIDRIDAMEKPDLDRVPCEFFVPVLEKGLFGALWELKTQYKQGFMVWLDKVLLHQETVELCEYFGLNPYTLLSGFCAVAAGDDKTQKALKDRGLLFYKIGYTTDNNDALVVYDDKKMSLTKPKEDAVNELH